MILHTLNRSPLESTVYRQALRALAEDDKLLLIEDAVLGALPAQQALWSSLPGRLLR
jgi:tRNA 2-thiouridine synthesizing protein B